IRDSAENGLRQAPDELPDSQGKADRDDALPGRRLKRTNKQSERLTCSHRDEQDRRGGEHQIAASVLPGCCRVQTWHGSTSFYRTRLSSAEDQVRVGCILLPVRAELLDDPAHLRVIENTDFSQGQRHSVLEREVFHLAGKQD